MIFSVSGLDDADELGHGQGPHVVIALEVASEGGASAADSGMVMAQGHEQGRL